MIEDKKAAFAVIMISSAAVGYGIYCLYQACRYFAKVKRIKNTLTSEIGELTEGTREIKGRVTERGKKLRAPMTGKPCVYYEFTVTQNAGEDNASTIIHDKPIARCHVDDGTGAASINLNGADLVLDAVRHESSGVLNSASPRLESILARYKKISKGWVFNKKLQYTETILEVGDELYVLGPAKVAKGNVWFKASNGQPLIVTDKSERMLLENFTTKALLNTFGAVMLLVGVAVALIMLKPFS